MRIDLTKEAIASAALYDYFSSFPNSVVHSWHPPDSKAYCTRLLYIPHDGKRYHVDLIVQIGKTLYLIEVKDCLENSYDDVAKLRQITGSFSTGELVRQFQRQGEVFSVIPCKTGIAIAAKDADEAFLAANWDIPVLLANGEAVRGANDLGDDLLARLAGAL